MKNPQNTHFSPPFQHAEEMAQRQKDFAKHFQTEVDNLTAEHEAEIRRLKSLSTQAGTAAGHIADHVCPSDAT